jgi:beta-glucosidase
LEYLNSLLNELISEICINREENQMKLPILLFLLILTLLYSQEKPVYLDQAVPSHDRLNDLLDRMSLEEKIGQMCQYVGIKHNRENRYETIQKIRNSDNGTFYPELSVDDLVELIRKGQVGSFLHVADVDEMNFLQQQAEQSRLGIPLLMGTDASHGHGMYRGATVFPTLIGLASTWNPDLIRDIGRITAREMRATGYHWTFSVNLSIARDPRWGRVGETFGEDPYLVGQLGAALTRGYQSDEFSRENIISCANYFIASSTPLNGTNFAPMEISERTLREIYLPPYQDCVDAGVYTIMAAHNDINGIPCHANRFFFTDLLRNELNFKGFVVTDWMDIERLETLHHIANSQKEAIKLAIQAGIDMNMHGPGFFEQVLELVRTGEISEERIDESVRKILFAKFQLGLFEDRYTDPGESNILLNINHREKSLQAARESIVLLKNENILPLSDSVRSIFVTGPNANNKTILGDWTLDQPDENLITVLQGIRTVAQKREVQVEYFNCGQDLKNMDIALVNEAGEKAAGFDVAIVVVGENSLRFTNNPRTCGENADRDRIDLVGEQLALVQQVANSSTPTIVVLVNGRPLALPWVYEHIPAVLETWEPGMLGGQAIAEILFGEVNPSGKLPITIPRSVGQIPSIYNHKPSHYFRKYVVGETGPYFPFGFGLSYTTFQYHNLKISDSIGETATVSIEVTNTGNRTGTEIVQLYIHDQVASVTRLVKELKGFKKVTLKPGETTNVRFDIFPEQLSLINLNMQRRIEPGLFDIMLGPNSADVDTVIFEYKK